MSTITNFNPSLGSTPSDVSGQIDQAVTQGNINAPAQAKTVDLMNVPGDTGSITSDPLRNQNGAPALAEPSQEFSADDLIALLQNLRSKSQDQQLQTTTKTLENQRIKAQQNNEAQAKKIQDWIEKSEKAAKSGFFGKLFSWVGKIAAVVAAAVAVVASVVATPFTGGAAAALTALAVVGLIAATTSLADQISKECGGPEISISNGMTQMVSSILKGLGVDDELAEKIGRTLAPLVAVIVPAALLVEPELLGTMAQGIAELAGASEETAGWIKFGVGLTASIGIGIATAIAGGKIADAEKITRTLTDKIISATSSAVKGATSVAQGSAGIAQAVYTNQGENAKADQQQLKALLTKINAQMEDQREELRKIIQQLEEGVQAVSKMIQESADSMSQITGNIGRRATV